MERRDYRVHSLDLTTAQADTDPVEIDIDSDEFIIGRIDSPIRVRFDNPKGDIFTINGPRRFRRRQDIADPGQPFHRLYASWDAGLGAAEILIAEGFDTWQSSPDHSGLYVTNSEILLASAARTATTVSAVFKSHGARCLIVELNVTVSPGIETLRTDLRYVSPIDANQNNNYCIASANAIPADGLQLVVVGPGVTTSPAMGNGSVAKAMPIPPEMLVRIAHSAASSWTYSVGITRIY